MWAVTGKDRLDLIKGKPFKYANGFTIFELDWDWQIHFVFFPSPLPRKLINRLLLFFFPRINSFPNRGKRLAIFSFGPVFSALLLMCRYFVEGLRDKRGRGSRWKVFSSFQRVCQIWQPELSRFSPSRNSLLSLSIRKSHRVSFPNFALPTFSLSRTKSDKKVKHQI